MGATADLARAVTDTTYDALPADVIRVSKHVILDGCANILAGSQEPLSRLTTEYIISLEGPPAASVAGHNFKTHPVHAAYANGVFCHSMDYELMWYPPTHPTSPTLPALLALAETRGLTTREVIPAIAAGFEVQGRLRFAIDNAGITLPESFHPPGQVGPFGAAAGSAVLLGLDVRDTQRALGIAGSRVGGLMANTGTMTKATHCGNAARLGLEAALLAEQGFTANEHILEATHGYNDVLFNGRINLADVTDGYGDPYRMVTPGLTVKKYPAQYPTHWSIDAAVTVRSKHPLDPDEIDRVEVVVGKGNEAARRTHPTTGLDGKFSIAYTVAAALLDGTVDIDTFSDERRFADDMEALLNRIEVIERDDIPGMDFAAMWSRVTVHTRSGDTYTNRVDRPPGIWDNPLTWAEHTEKFHECATRVLTDAQTTTLQALIEDFDEPQPIQPVIDLLRNPTHNTHA